MSGASGEPRDSPGRARYLGFGLPASLMWVPVPLVLSLSLPAGQKGWTDAALLVAGETAFWVSAVLPGREVVRRYRSYLDPRLPFRREGP